VVNKKEHQILKEKLDQVINSCQEQSLFSTALLFWIIALVIEVTLRIFDWYKTVPEVDLLSHLFAGIAIAASLFWLSEKWKWTHYRGIAIVGTIIISLLWELAESLQEILFYNPPHLLDFFIWDGFVDIIIAFVGAIIFVLVRKKNKT